MSASSSSFYSGTVAAGRVGVGVRRYQMLSRSSGHMYCSSGAQLSLVNANGEGEVVHSQEEEEEDFAATTASPLGDI